MGRYEILGELGRGAMGVVYKARDPKIDRLVAIKTISIFAHTPEEDREFRERLFTEAKAAGRLSHPGIVTVYDVSEDPDTLNPYIVMEYVAGDSLEKKVAESADRFPLSTVLSLVEQVAEALDYAHSQGIVHRDIKPANILLPENGPPKITDFGIAKLNFGHPASLADAMGTPAFMSPEQLNGDPVDGRSDLFSLGVVLYTLLTGYRPFQGNSALTISFKVVNRNPLPATTFDSSFPPDLDHVISRAMAKDPAQRYATGREMAAEVRALREAIGQACRSEAGSFDDVYVQRASKVASSASALNNLSARNRSTGSATRSQKTWWRDWHLISAAFLALAVTTLVSAFVWQKRALSKSAGEQASPISSESSHTGKRSDSVIQSISEHPIANSVPKSGARTGNAAGPYVRKNVVIAAKNVETAAAAPPRQIAYAARSDATLRLRIEHHFAQAEVLVWVDDKLAYKQALDGVVKKKMVLLKGVEGYQSDSIPVASGHHRFRVRVHASDNSYDQTASIFGSLPQEGERQLLIQCEKHKPVHLSVQ
ncbi:MAG TPA: serine/threonine-protein kinase [Terriglobales bacterium]|nr:serine/threonine-protein kinase [Terriglobales bacterium]